MFLDNLNWRHATKEFDPAKTVSQEDLDKILEAIRLAPTSMGLQFFKVLLISDQDLKNKLKPLARDQAQINTCQYLLVFCSNTDIDQTIDDYLEESNKINPVEPAKLSDLKKSRKQYMQSKSAEELLIWISKQIYIVLGFAMAACAELKVDSCPMEGFIKEDFDKALDLSANFKSQVLLPIGYRKEEPKRQKVRLPNNKIFIKK
jgi:nitroreductase / dihydropteridine reductase